jgi:hypothetical protein
LGLKTREGRVTRTTHIFLFEVSTIKNKYMLKKFIIFGKALITSLASTENGLETIYCRGKPYDDT